MTAQLFLCFLIPGFLRVDKLNALIVIFISIWLVAMTVLLVSLKLDGELTHWLWTFTLIPLWLALVSQMIAFPFNVIDFGVRVVLVVVTLLLALQLDAVIKMPWVVIFAPVLFLLFVDALVI